MAELEVAELKALLYNQYIINGKLFMELEDEREASATAASEALSMVLRLEREKALETVEACQYKRISEVKMCYIEECSVALEKLVQQKDIEISVLKSQLHAYKLKLSSFTRNRSVDGDIITHNNLWEKNRLPRTVRRCKSLPSLRLVMLNLETDGSSNGKPSFQSGSLVRRSTRDTSLITEVGTCDSKEIKGKKKCELVPGSNYYQKSEHINLWSSKEKYAAWSQRSASNANTSMLNSNISAVPGACLVSETGQENEVKPDEFITFCSNMESDWINQFLEPEVGMCCLRVPGELDKPFMDDPIWGTKKTIGMEDFELRNLNDMLLNGTFVHRNCISKFSSSRKGAFLHQAFEVSTRTKCALMNCKSIIVKHGNEDSSMDQNCTKPIQAPAQYVQDELKLKLSGQEERWKLFKKLYEQLKKMKHEIKWDRPRKCHLNDVPKVAYIMEAALSFSI